MADGQPVEVEADGLDRKATEIEQAAPPTIRWRRTRRTGRGRWPGWAAIVLNSNAANVQAHLTSGEAEGRRMAESLRAAAQAYREADRLSAAALENGQPGIEPVPVTPNLSPPVPVFPEPNLCAAGVHAHQRRGQRAADAAGLEQRSGRCRWSHSPTTGKSYGRCRFPTQASRFETRPQYGPAPLPRAAAASMKGPPGVAARQMQLDSPHAIWRTRRGTSSTRSQTRPVDGEHPRLGEDGAGGTGRCRADDIPELRARGE